MAVDYDPFAPAFRDDPYPAYAALRADAPVHFAPETGAWCVARYEDVRTILRDAERFSSDAMRTFLIGAPPGVDPQSDPEAARRMIALAQALPFPIESLATARSVIALDPPAHGSMRSLVSRGFTPRRIAAWEPRIRTLTGECMAALRGRADLDLVRDLAIPLPVQIITEMLGVEHERRADFKRWSDEIIAGSTGSGRALEPAASGFAAAMGSLSEYVSGVADRRRREPGDDLVSVLLEAQEGEVALTDAELAFFVLLLLVAGNETTTNLIGNAANALLRRPDQLARLRADRSLVPAFVEEALRFDSPVQFVFRRSTVDVELAGTRIPANSHVVPLIGSANRDERHWGPTAAALDVTRDTSGHVAFGLGNHFCLGAALARLEARIVLDELLDDLAELEHRDAHVEYIDSFLVRGPRTLPLRRAA